MSVAAIILAAGASHRLGQPKQLVRVAGETLLGRTMRLARESGAAPVFVVLGAQSEQIAAAMDWTGAIPVLNADWQTGMASSLRAGVLAVLERAPEAAAAMLVVCDQPKLTAEYLIEMIAAAERSSYASIVASRYAGQNGVPAIFPASEFQSLLALSGDAGARSLLSRNLGSILAIDFAAGEMDIDTPADLRRMTTDE